ncbi:hypothetical protein MKW94_008556 [Papaver nudicaule]|uniref:Replication factor A C-terminal domain-containing protein n=1 Tax=Papaver nudicaule TaxID=74823 RepID=A0AA41SJ84_PAPNU|nr:hypothetical protein [Papaver nudicaule]
MMAIPRYKLNLRVHDNTGHAVFVALGQTAEQIVGMVVRELMEKYEETADGNEAQNIPELAEKVNNKTYVFHIKIDPREFGYRLFTISSIYPVSIELENKYQLQGIQKDTAEGQSTDTEQDHLGTNEGNTNAAGDNKDSQPKNVEERTMVREKKRAHP